MADETHKLQKDPPEGSRNVIDRELRRQDGGNAENGREKDARKLKPDNRQKDGVGQDAAVKRGKSQIDP